MIDSFLQQHLSYHLSLMILLVLLVRSLRWIRELRELFASVVYLTIGLWYYVDPVYIPKTYAQIFPEEFTLAYFQVTVFLIVFAAITRQLMPPTPTSVIKHLNLNDRAGMLAMGCVFFFWFILFSIGMYRANFAFVETLFPLGGRSNWESQMWVRPRVVRR